MKLKKFGYYLISISALLWLSQAGYAQEEGAGGSEPSSASSSSQGEEEKLYGNYMEIQVAKRSADILVKINKDRLQKLKIATRNFGEGEDQSKYDQLAADYVSALKDYYKRNYLAADSALKQNRKGIDELAISLSQKYEVRANEILTRCADELVETELGVDTQPDVDPELSAKTFKVIQKNKIRLLIAYDQINMAKEAVMKGQYEQSIVHYRMAKEHGIQMLIDLSETEDERESLRQEFEKDTTDAINRVAGS